MRMELKERERRIGMMELAEGQEIAEADIQVGARCFLSEMTRRR